MSRFLRDLGVRKCGGGNARMASLLLLPPAWLSDCDGVCDVARVLWLKEPSWQAIVFNPSAAVAVRRVAVESDAQGLGRDRYDEDGIVAAGVRLTYWGCRGTRCVRKAVASIW